MKLEAGYDAADFIQDLKIKSKEELLNNLVLYKDEEVKDSKELKAKNITGGGEGGFIALGYEGDSNIIWSNTRNCVAKVSSASDHLKLRSLFGSDWIRENFTKYNSKGEITGVAWEELTAYLADSCSDAGVYTQEMIREQGVWLDEDSDNLVVNSHIIARTDGKNQERVGKGKYVYSCEASIGEPLSEDIKEATDDEVASVYKALSSNNYKYKSDINFLFGWLSCSFILGALEWRPHVILTGRRGSGKSTIDNFVANILKGYAIHAEGDSSAAGLRQKLKNGAQPVVIDEFGNEDEDFASKSKMLQMIRLMRTACSDMGSGTLRGTADQSGTSFSVKFMAMVSGTTPPPLTAADSTRMVTVELQELEEGSQLPKLFADRKLQLEIGKKMFKRMINSYKEFSHNYETFRTVIVETGNSARAADTIGTLLAGCSTMLKKERLTKEKALKILENIDLSEHKEAQEHSDEMDCLDHLLTYQIQYEEEVIGENKSGMIRRTSNIFNLARKVVFENDIFIDRQLQEYGIKAEAIDSNSIMIHIKTKKKHVLLNKIFSGTRWLNGGWSKQFRRLEGMVYGNKQIDRISEKAVGVIVNVKENKGDGDI